MTLTSPPGPFAATAGTGPYFATATNGGGYQPLLSLGWVACHLAGGNAFVHNGARVVDNGDGTLGFFFTLRNCDGSRRDNQVYYAESFDNGDSWGEPVGIYPGGVTIGGNAVGNGFSLADVVVSGGQRVIYFNAYDDSDNLIVGASPPVPRPRGPASPIPASSPASLALLALLLLAAAAVAIRRRA